MFEFFRSLSNFACNWNILLYASQDIYASQEESRKEALMQDVPGVASHSMRNKQVNAYTHTRKCAWHWPRAPHRRWWEDRPRTGSAPLCDFAAILHTISLSNTAAVYCDTPPRSFIIKDTHANMHMHACTCIYIQIISYVYIYIHIMYRLCPVTCKIDGNRSDEVQ